MGQNKMAVIVTVTRYVLSLQTRAQTQTEGSGGAALQPGLHPGTLGVYVCVGRGELVQAEASGGISSGSRCCLELFDS